MTNYAHDFTDEGVGAIAAVVGVTKPKDGPTNRSLGRIMRAAKQYAKVADTDCDRCKQITGSITKFLPGTISLAHAEWERLHDSLKKAWENSMVSGNYSIGMTEIEDACEAAAKAAKEPAPAA